ncbi:MAG TPA: tetratricopeptide repeat protein [Thermoanaerobaculia bacterium]|jgi:tetratricopeptide (TPR) repeat protein
MKKKLCLLAALSLSLFSLASCQQIQARTEIKTANEAYAKEEYATALKHYVEARKHAGEQFPDLDRMIGYSHIGMFVPEDKSPQNTANADAAIGELRKYLKKRPEDNIARDALINLYLNAERTTEAINYFRDWLQTHPNDLEAVKSIATLYAKQGNFNESLNWYEKITLLDARNPESFYIYGVVCYEKVAKNPPADMAERMALIEKGKSALQKSITIKPDYFESMAYLNLLFRQQALLETDPVKQQALIAQADAVRGQAMEIIRRKKAAAAPAGAPKQS